MCLLDKSTAKVIITRKSPSRGLFRFFPVFRDLRGSYLGVREGVRLRYLPRPLWKIDTVTQRETYLLQKWPPPKIASSFSWFVERAPALMKGSSENAIFPSIFCRGFKPTPN